MVEQALEDSHKLVVQAVWEGEEPQAKEAMQV